MSMANLSAAAPEASERNRGYGYRPKLVWDAGVQEYLEQAYGPELFAEMSLALTRPTITSTLRVNTQQTTTQEVMEQLRLHFQQPSIPNSARAGGRGSEQRPLALEHVALASMSGENLQVTESKGRCKNGTLPDHARVDGVTGANDEPICWEHPVLKDVVIVRGRGPCEVDCRNERGEPLLKEVLVSRKCAEAVLRGANVFVPGVLACSLHVEKGDEVAVSAALERPDANGSWSVGVTRGTTLESNHAKSQLDGSTCYDSFIGKGQVTMSRSALFKQTHGVAVEMTDRVFDLPPFHGILKGHIFLQNLPSIVTARVLDPKPGERILDMCAAPGGKTTAIAIFMKDEGKIIALDRSHNKVLEIKQLSEEMNLTCIQAYKMDATKVVTKGNIVDTTEGKPLQPVGCASEILSSSHVAAEMTSTQPHLELHPTHTGYSNLKKGAYPSQAAARKQARRLTNMSKRGQIGRNLQHLKGLHPQSFDRVLLDAPCSALGLRPRLFGGQETMESLRSHACYQRKLLDQAVQLVRPGGTLVYSTCTMNPGENEGIVRYALDKYDFLSLLPQEPIIGGPGLVGGIHVFDGMSYKEWLREEEKDLVQRFSPAGLYDTIGFFIAKFAVDSKEGQFDV